jgi:hypothetical protein
VKKNILVLLLILAGAFCLILILVRKSDPETLVINFPRRYNGISATREDTIRLPGMPTTMEIEGNMLYGYLHRQGIIIRYDLENRKADTLLHIRSLFSGAISGVDMDTATNIFYFFGSGANRIYRFHPQDSIKDSLSSGKISLYGGKKCLAGSDFFIRTVDNASSLTSLKKVDCIQHKDTTLYTFAQFKDGGISADGFFLKDKLSKKQFYIPYYNSEIIQYDELNNKVSKIITIDKTKPFNCTVATYQGYSITSKSRINNIAATTDSAHLYLLSYTISRGKNELPGTVVDVYSTVTGEYEQSLQFPYFEGRPASLLYKSGERLFVAFGNTILRYKIQYQ